MQRLQIFTATVQAAVVPCCRVGNNVINRRRNKINNPISNNYGRVHNIQLLYSTTTTTRKNPFRVLGLPSFTSFSIVQKKFLKLAMTHHPDTKADNNNNDTGTGTGTGTGTTGNAPNSINDDFVRIRTAYEQIRKEHNRRQLRERSTTFTPTRRTSQNDTATDRNNNNNNDTNTTDSDSSSFTFTSEEEEHEFLDWFYDMSKVRITSMQRKEMVAVYWKQTRLQEHYPGGQFWDFARRLVTFQDAFLQNREKNNKNNRNEESKTATTTKKNKNKMKENINIRRKRHPRGR
ncbi:hypothetical protein FRACYDRAFT_254315 [Fragilariopsis cylindrus CCMP1102]|uniref:J domain-containing protein n=1 Tax=Fragilariopsis cylindrus CCMP1102 TaxID=635003 RepID=A0A1E7ELZ7_9STRA|nr:hypothetical protein FRACYDRAFT_254315 [Fragilariopsis cylindrus CCMP1102]|eukprot:OEU06593.1 hypothetical protein FRACYDRAFT_254315 [Fragilariopsis cylindrus CCMP1102]